MRTARVSSNKYIPQILLDGFWDILGSVQFLNLYQALPLISVDHSHWRLGKFSLFKKQSHFNLGTKPRKGCSSISGRSILDVPWHCICLGQGWHQERWEDGGGSGRWFVRGRPDRMRNTLRTRGPGSSLLEKGAVKAETGEKENETCGLDLHIGVTSWAWVFINRY